MKRSEYETGEFMQTKTCQLSLDLDAACSDRELVVKHSAEKVVLSFAEASMAKAEESKKALRALVLEHAKSIRW